MNFIILFFDAVDTICRLVGCFQTRSHIKGRVSCHDEIHLSKLYFQRTFCSQMNSLPAKKVFLRIFQSAFFIFRYMH